MNINKLRNAYLSGNPRVFRYSNVFGFIQHCWGNKFTPDNSVTMYDEEEHKMYLVKKEHEDEFN